MNELTIGRIVHVKAFNRCYPAIVTRVETATELYATSFEPLKEANLTGRIKHGFELDNWHWPGECKS